LAKQYLTTKSLKNLEVAAWVLCIRRQKLERSVAVKFLPPHQSQAEDEKKRFIHEAKAASALHPPNICTICEMDEIDDGQMYCHGPL